MGMFFGILENGEIAYTKTVGVKIHQDGSMKRFPGNTIVCNLSSQQPFHTTLIEIQSMYIKSSFAHKYSFLPPQSFHMTLFPMLCLDTLQNWNQTCHLNMSLEETDAHFGKIVKNCNLLERCQRLEMKAIKISGENSIFVWVVPVDPENGKMLQSLHWEVTDKTGVRIQPDYGFHLSIAYPYIELTEQEKQEKLEIQKEIDKKVHGLTLTLLPGEFTVYEDMGKFVKYQGMETRIDLSKKEQY